MNISLSNLKICNLKVQYVRNGYLSISYSEHRLSVEVYTASTGAVDQDRLGVAG